MLGLLDFMFSSLDIESLDHQKTKEYLRYIQEITPQVPTLGEKIKLFDYHVRLTNRLTYLDRTKSEDLDKVLVKSRLAIKSKKAKHHLV